MNKSDEQSAQEYIEGLFKEISDLQEENSKLTTGRNSYRTSWIIALVALIVSIILNTVIMCNAQTIGSTMGYNGGLYTTVEVGTNLWQEKAVAAAYLAIPYWRSGDMNYQGKLYGYKQLGYFAGLRLQFAIRKLQIGGAVQYEKYSFNMHSIATYPDAIKRGELKDWKIRPYACIDYQLHPCIYAGVNVGKLSDVHIRFNVKIKQP